VEEPVTEASSSLPSSTDNFISPTLDTTVTCQWDGSRDRLTKSNLNGAFYADTTRLFGDGWRSVRQTPRVTQTPVTKVMYGRRISTSVNYRGRQM